MTILSCVVAGPAADSGTADTAIEVEQWLTESHGGEARRIALQSAEVDLALGTDALVYDFDAVTAPVDLRDLPFEDELSVAVRLVLSEVGPDRLLLSRNGLIEAIGVLQTVDHRMDPTMYNPEGLAEAPAFDGCGEGRTWTDCASEPSQYLGMATRRALQPAQAFPPALLGAAVDRAVLAWWLVREGLVEDLVEGATNYVHRCGGAAYGMPTPYCDAHMGRPGRDVRGAQAHTGPIMFQAPTTWLENRGHYSVEPVRFVHFDPWFTFDGGLAPNSGWFEHAFFVPDAGADGLVDLFAPELDVDLQGALADAASLVRCPAGDDLPGFLGCS